MEPLFISWGKCLLSYSLSAHGDIKPFWSFWPLTTHFFSFLWPYPLVRLGKTKKKKNNLHKNTQKDYNPAPAKKEGESLVEFASRFIDKPDTNNAMKRQREDVEKKPFHSTRPVLNKEPVKTATHDREGSRESIKHKVSPIQKWAWRSGQERFVKQSPEGQLIKRVAWVKGLTPSEYLAGQAGTVSRVKSWEP